MMQETKNYHRRAILGDRHLVQILDDTGKEISGVWATGSKFMGVKRDANTGVNKPIYEQQTVTTDQLKAYARKRKITLRFNDKFPIFYRDPEDRLRLHAEAEAIRKAV